MWIMTINVAQARNPAASAYEDSCAEAATWPLATFRMIPKERNDWLGI